MSKRNHSILEHLANILVTGQNEHCSTARAVSVRSLEGTIQSTWSVLPHCTIKKHTDVKI